MTKQKFLDVFILLIITAPAFLALLNGAYFSMHDDQHIARLFLLDKGMRQGYWYPRWVDMLGFGFGYPLFNFYPPLVYYGAQLFHLAGFSFAWSIKLMFVTGFIGAAVGIFFFVRTILGRIPAFLSALLYTYFFYHAVNAYVRGALAEFFSMALLPFLFWAIDYLTKKLNIQGSIFFGIIFALLILTHPLIAFPSLFFVLFFVCFYFFVSQHKIHFLKYVMVGVLFGLGLSSFFWLPSMFEKQFTLVNDILTTELALYKLHYVYPFQLWYSPWGYGGSIAGPNDGMTFQLGKIHIALAIGAFVCSLLYFLRKRNLDRYLKYFYFVTVLLMFSLFMATPLSFFVWDAIRYLWYLQFPWRFLTFAGFFISVVGAFFVYFFGEVFGSIFLKRYKGIMSIVLIVIIGGIILFKYQHYFNPQKRIFTEEQELIQFEEIAWRVSNTSFEFMPKGVQTKKSPFNTTVVDIQKNELPKNIYEILSGEATITIQQNTLQSKLFDIHVQSPLSLRISTSYFPGWKAFLNNKKIPIDDGNKFKLITVSIPEGNHQLRVEFQNTPIRNGGNFLSIGTFMLMVAGILRLRVQKNK